MNVGIAIFELLSNNAAVANIVDNRIFPVITSKGAALPFVTYDVITISPNDTKTGPALVDEIDVEIVCHAETYQNAVELNNAVRLALDRVGFQNESVSVQSFQYQTGNIEVTDQPRKIYAVAEFQAYVRRDAGTIHLGQPVAVTDGDGTIHQVTPGGSYTCIQVAPPIAGTPSPVAAGHIYNRVIPWDGLESFDVVGSVEWHRAAGTYDYNVPTNPKNTAIRANGYFPDDARSLLMFENRFGNFYRWTNDIGQQFTEKFHKSPDNNSTNPQMCFDHLTGLIVYVMRAYDERLDLKQTDWIDYANQLNYGQQSWRVADVAEFVSMFEFNDLANAWQSAYTPFIDDDVRNYGASIVFGSRNNDGNMTFVRTNSTTFAQTGNFDVVFAHALIVANQYD